MYARKNNFEHWKLLDTHRVNNLSEKIYFKIKMFKNKLICRKGEGHLSLKLVSNFKLQIYS